MLWSMTVSRVIAMSKVLLAQGKSNMLHAVSVMLTWPNTIVAYAVSILHTGVGQHCTLANLISQFTAVISAQPPLDLLVSHTSKHVFC